MEPIIIKIPRFSLVCLIGISGSGKTTFARQHFQSTEILSSDYFRSMIIDDEANQSVTAEAFDCLYFLAKKRLRYRRLTVIDATSVQKRARNSILYLARDFHCPTVAIVLDLPLEHCLKMNQARPHRQTPPDVVKRQSLQLAESLAQLPSEDFQRIFLIQSPAQLDQVRIIFDDPTLPNELAATGFGADWEETLWEMVDNEGVCYTNI